MAITWKGGVKVRLTGCPIVNGAERQRFWDAPLSVNLRKLKAYIVLITVVESNLLRWTLV